MPDIKFSCPHCDQHLEAPDDMGGEQIECPSCRMMIGIPEATVTKRLARKKPQAALSTPRALGLICPNCNAELPVGAVLCVDCGTNLKTGKKVGTQFAGGNPGTPTSQPKEFPWKTVTALATVLVLGLVVFGYHRIEGKRDPRGKSFQTNSATGKEGNLGVSVDKGKAKAGGIGGDDEQYYQYVKTKFTHSSSPQEKVDLLKAYLDKHPKGRHVGEVTALLEEAEEEKEQRDAAQKVAIVDIDCRDSEGFAVSGWFQVFDCSGVDYANVLLKAYHDPRAKELQAAIGNAKSIRSSTGLSTARLFRKHHLERFGDVIRDQIETMPLVGTWNITHGSARIALPAGPSPRAYFVFGSGHQAAGLVTGFAEGMTIEGGKKYLVRIKNAFSADLDPESFMNPWRPIE